MRGLGPVDRRSDYRRGRPGCVGGNHPRGIGRGGGRDVARRSRGGVYWWRRDWSRSAHVSACRHGHISWRRINCRGVNRRRINRRGVNRVSGRISAVAVTRPPEAQGDAPPAAAEGDAQSTPTAAVATPATSIITAPPTAVAAAPAPTATTTPSPTVTATPTASTAAAPASSLDSRSEGQRGNHERQNNNLLHGLLSAKTAHLD
jgi:hypothetical protein